MVVRYAQQNYRTVNIGPGPWATKAAPRLFRGDLEECASFAQNSGLKDIESASMKK